MRVRDEVESVLRQWDKHETDRGAHAVIDFDFCPSDEPVTAARSRLTVYRQLAELQHAAETDGDRPLVERIETHLTFLRALMGVRAPLREYIRATQGCDALGWPNAHIEACRDQAIKQLDALGISWGKNTTQDLNELEGPLTVDEAPDAIQEAASRYEPKVREVTGATGTFNLSVSAVNVDEYWAYWLDGRGSDARLRLNLRTARFTQVKARQFGLHEVLGHALQAANISARCSEEDVPWVRILCVHSNQQVLFEGLAQALPHFIAPDDDILIARTRLDHYLELVRAELHLAINNGATIEQCAEHAIDRAPFWSDGQIADYLTDRGANPLLRSYQWAYPAGIDWFTALADNADDATADQVLRSAYRQPLTPEGLANLWPGGPAIGGSGTDLAWLRLH